jgi:hypothetical protein
MTLLGPQRDSPIRHIFSPLARGLLGAAARHPGHYFSFGLEPRGAA